ncbi:MULTISPECIES: two-component regulator propeller domain-containing protein [Olivibacter]|uniref:histidine kinase n=1 Tax=Olivibacter oleidegradans TaxID=760123 RepID=A0ABV6HKV5_9SPHI|nr:MULTISPECIES: two-component regulator propeller domain-containing protein [Olivibacter]QEL01457.1 response regulator [Olivibacter sp. LS-1]
MKCFFAKPLLVVISLLTSFYILEAKDIRFLHLDVTEGLSQGSVFAIVQDYKGFIWIGTRDGLNKYNARKFIVYRNNPKDTTSLGDNFIQSIAEDSKKRLWIGTGNGLNLYDRALDNFRRIPLANVETASSPSEPAVHFIMEDHDHQVWVGTNQGLYRIKEDTQIVAELVFNNISVDIGDEKRYFKNIRSIYEDSEHKLWFCTDEGVVSTSYVPPYKKLRINRAYPTYARLTEARDQRAVAILEISPHVFWIATKTNGIAVLNEKTGEISYHKHIEGDPYSLPSNDIRSITKDRKGRLWIGTFNGLSLYEHGRFKSFHANDNDEYSLSNNSIRPIYQDKRGSIWIGTYFGGLNVIDNDIPAFKNFAHQPHNNSLSYNVVSSFAEDGMGNLIIGTEGGGINYLDNRQLKFKHAKYQAGEAGSLSHNNVKSLCIDREGNLWIGTYDGGLNLKRKGATNFEHIKHNPNNDRSLSNDNIYALAEDSKGDLWVGTYGGGLNVKRRGDRTLSFDKYNLENKKLSSNMVRSIYEDSQGNLWVGTQNGLNLKRRGSDYFQTFVCDPNNPKSISGNDIISIHEDGLHRIWVGTYMNGLNLYHPNDNNFTHFNANMGLPGNNIFGILSDDHHNLWLSTNAGISCFNPNTESVRNYNTIDGLIGDEFIYGAYHKLANGTLAFGSSAGFTLFDPDSISINYFEPPVVFTDLRLFNKKIVPESQSVIDKDISLLDELVLNHKQYVFSVEFSVLNYIHADKNKYAYLLKGFDNDWNFVNTPIATYTNLDPGTYELMVKGTNNDGIWSKPTSLIIHILPPPWKTWWAYGLYLLLVSIVAYFVIQFLKGRNQLKHELLLEHLALEKQKEIHEAKLNFFTNISHEFRTPLSLIVGPIERLQEEDLPTNAKPLLHNAYKNANRLLNLVNQLLDFRKQESGHLDLQIQKTNLVRFVEEIVSNFLFLAAKKNVQITIENKINDGVDVWIDHEQMEKVLTNLLYNAFKFTDSEGRIKVQIEKKIETPIYPSGNCIIEVWDTGCGIPEKHLPYIFAQFYQSKSYEDQTHTGSGVGLALAQGLVKMHHGNLSVRSNLAKELNDFNTVFRIELPLGKSHFKATQLLANENKMELHKVNDLNDALSCDAKEEEVVDNSTNQSVVLIVEDNVELRRFIVGSLQDKFKVLEAGDGLEAWPIVESIQPDIVVTDVMMPTCDGISLLRKIKGEKNTNHIPVILLTARTADPYMMEAFKEGGDDYITKPFSFKLLAWKIANMLESRKRLKEKFVQEYLLQPHKTDVVETNSFMDDVITIVEENLNDDNFSVHALASEVGVSRTVLYRKIRQLSGLNLVEFIKVVRLKKAAQLLETNSGLTISEIAYKVGFSDPKYFSKSFKAFYHKSPKRYIEDVMEQKSKLNMI